MRTRLAVSVLLAGAACAPATRYTDPVPESQRGRYEFREAVRESSRGTVVAGSFTVTADSVAVTVTEPPTATHCLADQPSNLRRFVYRCGNLRLEIDRRIPSSPVVFEIDDYKLDTTSSCIGRVVPRDERAVCDRVAEEMPEVRATLKGYARTTRVN